MAEDRDRVDGASGLTLPHLIKWAEMAVRARVDAALSGMPISSGQLFALVLLDEQKEATSAELARLMHVMPQSLTTMLGPLREQGLIERRTDDAHRSRLLLRLTERGKRIIAEARALTPQIEGDLLDDLSAEERTTLLRLLVRIARPRLAIATA
jgi:DNA-binding MarR family transcriptional regulator